jgi:PAS domain S-box-containing protein
MPDAKRPDRINDRLSSPPLRVSWRRSLRTRVIFSFSLTAALLVTICLLAISQGIPFSSYHGLYAQDEKEAWGKLNLLADIGQQRLERWIKTKQIEAQELADEPELRNSLPGLLAAGLRKLPASADYQTLASCCASRLSGHPDYDSIDILAPAGCQVLFSTRPGREGAVHSEISCLNSPLDSARFCQFPTEPGSFPPRLIIDYCRPIRSPDGRTLAILVLRLKSDAALAPLFSRFARPDQSLEAVLLNQKGIPLLPLPRDFPRKKEKKPSGSYTSAATRLALSGRTGTIITQDYRGATVLAAYRPILILPGEQSWGLVVQQRQAEIFASYKSDTRMAFAIAGLGLAVWVLLITLLSTRLTRPLLALSRAAEAVESGDLNARAELISSDEIGQLTVTFNQMLEHIHQWHQELEEAVRARTLELSRLNEELQNEIAQHCASEKARRQAADYNRSLIEASIDPLVTIGPDGKITDVNTATEEATGYARECLIGTDFCDYFIDPEKARAGYQQVFREGAVRDYPLELRHQKGAVTSVLYNATVYRDERGEVVGVFAAARDITEQKRAEEVRREHARFLQTMIDSLPTPVFYKDTEGRYLGCNKAFEILLGKSRQAIMGRALSDLIAPEGAEFNAQMDNRLLQAGGNQTYEYYLITADGAYREAIFSKAVFLNADGSLGGIIGTIIDITERKQTEAALRESEQRYRMLAENIIDVIWTTDLDIRLTYISPSVKRQRGYGPEELLGKTPEETMTPASALTVRSALRDLLARACDSSEESFAPARYEVEAFRKDGATFFAEVEITLLLDPLGQASGVLGVTRDISARKQAEQALLESERQFREVLENVNLIAVTLDLQGRIIFCNDFLLQLTGYDRREVIGKDWFEQFVPPETREVLRVTFDGKVPDGLFPSPYEGDVLTRAGDRHIISWSNTPLRDPRGEITGVTSIGEDITERKRAEAEIRRLNEELEQRVQLRTAELEAANKDLEAFAYSVSHDLRAPLRSIDGFSLGLLEEYQDKLGDPAKEDFRRIRNAAQYMGRLIEDLLGLSQVTRTRLQQTRVNLSRLARQIIGELQAAEPERKVTVKIAKGLESEGDANLLRAGLQNLLDNAWKFTGRRNRATIEFGLLGENGRKVYFVRDNGVGFDMAYVHKLFGVFQRLHSPSEFPGTGIGLVTVQKIIHRHGGEIWAEGAPGEGAIFYFTLGKE